jgi:glycosyltransferase involved in cell wall biosynthesis
MTVSVIIPTYNGADKIVHALRGLEQQRRQPDEVIVVIDGSTDGTAELLRKEHFALPGFRIVEQANKGRAGVRNRGAQEASGDLLVFMDDDILVPVDWLEHHIAHHENNAESILTGKLQSRGEGEPPEDEFHLFENWLNNRWNSENNKETEEAVLLNHPYVTAANFSIYRSTFGELNGFDERLKDAEDYDFAYRAKLKDKSLYISNKAWAYHNDKSLQNFKGYIKRLRQYNEAQMELIRIKPELFGNPLTNIRYPKQPSGLKSIVFRAFVGNYWIKGIDRGVWTWLPQKLRCTFYSYIVTANGVYFPQAKL